MCFHEAEDLISNLKAFFLRGLGLDELLQCWIRAFQDLANAFVFEMWGVTQKRLGMQRVSDAFVSLERAFMLRDFFGTMPDLHKIGRSDDLGQLSAHSAWYGIEIGIKFGPSCF